jgi:hypothetical protein
MAETFVPVFVSIWSVLGIMCIMFLSYRNETSAAE